LEFVVDGLHVGFSDHARTEGFDKEDRAKAVIVQKCGDSR
jgi:hypothetical protein